MSKHRSAENTIVTIVLHWELFRFLLRKNFISDKKLEYKDIGLLFFFF